MKNITKYKFIILFFIFSNIFRCTIPIREIYQEDLVFLFSIRELSNLELIKKFNLNKNESNSIDYFLLSSAYKEDTKIDEAGGFLIELIGKAQIRKFGSEQNYKSAFIIDIFKTKIDSSYATFDFLVAFSKLETLNFKERLQKIEYKFDSRLNEKIMERVFFETYNETERQECILMIKKEIETEFLEKYPNAIPDFISQNLYYTIYNRQLRCWFLNKKNEQ